MQKFKAIGVGSVSGAMAYVAITVFLFKEPLMPSVINGLVMGFIGSLAAMWMVKRKEKRSV